MKKFTKIFSLALGFALCMSLAACVGDPDNTGGNDEEEGKKDVFYEFLEENIVDDDYENYYEIFVGAFNDSDGNGLGDFKGVTQKLSYLRDLGYTGIWLMPICPSPSYHKYDITDYKAVDSSYGTMEDFDELVETAHGLGIKVIIDMVFNHSSNQHMWFQLACNAYRTEDTESPYYDYYNFSDTYLPGYRQSGWFYYEGQFDAGMPDLNLDSEAVQAELEDIMSFWLVDHDIDGFRLDAVRYYYLEDTNRSAEFTGWIQETADRIVKDAKGESAHAYIVGEDWASNSETALFYEKGKGSSFFAFSTSVTEGERYIANAINWATHVNGADTKYASRIFYNSQETLISMANGAIPAPFLCNHDINRAATSFGGEEDKIKFAYGLLSLYTGNTFTYYGDEIGVLGDKVGSGDAYVRVGMLWTQDTPILAPGRASKDKTRYYTFGSVEEQLADKNSILNYYKLCNNTRNAFPALMRGTPARVANDNDDVLVFTKTYAEETVTVIVNFSVSATTVSGVSGALKQGICVSGRIEQGANGLTMPGFSIAILA